MIKQIRTAAVGAALLLSAGTAATAATLDPSDPDDAILLSQKMACSLVEGEDVIYWWHGGAYSRVPGERDRHLFNVQGMNVRHCANFEDEERGHGYRLVSREILLYLDPETDEVLREWTNPWTDEVVEVIHVANDPVNMRSPRYAYDADGNGTAFRGRFIEGRVWTSGEAPLFYTNPLAGDYQEYVGGTYHAMEMLNSYGYEDTLLDPEQARLDDITISWARTSKWLPWMKMGDRVGMMVFTTVGKRIAAIEDLSEPLRTELLTNYPAYREPPPLDDDRPNVTSWIFFKRALEARQGDASDGEGS